MQNSLLAAPQIPGGVWAAPSWCFHEQHPWFCSGDSNNQPCYDSILGIRQPGDKNLTLFLSMEDKEASAPRTNLPVVYYAWLHGLSLD